MFTENCFYISQTASTNELCWELMKERNIPEGFVVVADFQTAGKGQSGNSWKSAAGKNLLFSMALYPLRVPIEEQFVISQAVSVGIKNILDTISDDITVKWPNDIYWKERKLAGILIETSLFRNKISKAVVGIGLNVNQTEFPGEVPNPISLKQITGKSFNREKLLNKIRASILDVYGQWMPKKIRSAYLQSLFRKDGYHLYQSETGIFRAKINRIYPDGALELETEKGETAKYYFKEVKFL
ncbi:MAG: biotin--[acetyl-CoA-carboxylase] ligase [Bacteroidales bacterium]|jgi:BirA family biotin operon repressor/biotin-[acetyl-CoA-carboxylase] ligase|nr:biotin--[acetyl-CoA-carboxylase] ligase [Bacteroidales bacterium]